MVFFISVHAWSLGKSFFTNSKRWIHPWSCGLGKEPWIQLHIVRCLVQRPEIVGYDGIGVDFFEGVKCGEVEEGTEFIQRGYVPSPSL